MKHRNRLWWLIVPIALLLVLCASGAVLGHFYTLFNDPTGRRPYPFGLVSLFSTNGSLGMDAENILPALARGDAQVFSNVLATPEAPITHNQILWDQSDFLQIANASWSHLWEQDIPGWDLVGLRFETRCQAGPTGFSSATMTYYRLQPDTPSQYDVRQLEIHPQLNQIDWGEDSSWPRFIFEDWINLDPTRLKVGADEALKIAKTRAMQAARLSPQGDCQIWLSLWRNDSGGWDFGFDGAAVKCPYYYFGMRVDPQTGDVHLGAC